MIVRVYLKDPDGFTDAVTEAAEASLEKSLSPDEAEVVQKLRESTVGEALGRWVADGEYVGIEFDTELKTAKVCTVEEVKRWNERG